MVVILLSLFPPTHELLSENQDSHSSIFWKKKKKKVKFAVKENSKGRKSGSGESRRRRKLLLIRACPQIEWLSTVEFAWTATFSSFLRPKSSPEKFRSRSNFRKQKREKSTDSLSQVSLPISHFTIWTWLLFYWMIESGIYICDYSFPRSMLLLRFGSVAASIIHIIACMGAVVVSDAILTANWFHRLMSRWKDRRNLMLGQWQNPVYQRISGPIVILTWTIVHFSYEEASRQSAHRPWMPVVLGIGTSLLNL